MSEQSEFDRGWDAAVQWCAETDRFVPRLHTLLDELGAPKGDGSVESRVRGLAQEHVREIYQINRIAASAQVERDALRQQLLECEEEFGELPEDCSVKELRQKRDSLRQQLEAKERECEASHGEVMDGHRCLDSAGAPPRSDEHPTIRARVEDMVSFARCAEMDATHSDLTKAGIDTHYGERELSLRERVEDLVHQRDRWECDFTAERGCVDGIRQQLEAKERECEDQHSTIRLLEAKQHDANIPTADHHGKALSLAERVELAMEREHDYDTLRDERDQAIKRAERAESGYRDLDKEQYETQLQCDKQRQRAEAAEQRGDEKAQQHAALALKYNNLVRDLGVALGKASRDPQELLECVRGLVGRAEAAERARDELRDKLRGDLARQLADGLDQIPIDEPADDSDARKECPGPSDLVAYEHREQRIDRCGERLDRLEQGLRRLASPGVSGFRAAKVVSDALGDE